MRIDPARLVVEDGRERPVVGGEFEILRVFARADFDPMTIAAAGMTAAGAGVSALGTLAGGSAAKTTGLMQEQADIYKAEQLEENAPGAIAASQRQMLDQQLKTNLAISTSRATSAAGGVNAGAGSAAANQGALAGRGSYLAAMDLFNGQNRATGLLNEAQGERYSGKIAEMGGEMAKNASFLAAGGQALSGAGAAYRTYKGS
jgi:hypothetical protein